MPILPLLRVSIVKFLKYILYRMDYRFPIVYTLQSNDVIITYLGLE